MRVWGSGLLAVLGVFLTAGTAYGAEAPAPPPDPLSPKQQQARCDNARALLKMGYFEDSEAAFKLLLGRASCAEQGIDDAKAAIAAKVVRDAKTEKATKQLPAADIERVKALRDAGFDSEAREELQKSVAAHPGASVPTELRAPDQRLGWWQDVLGRWGPRARVIVEAVVAFLAVIAALLASIAAVVVLKNVVVRLFGPSRIRLTDVAGAKDDQTASITAELQDALGRLARAQVGTQTRTSAAEPKFDLPSTVATAFPQVSLVAGMLQLVDRLLPRRLVTVDATLLEAIPSRGMAISLVLSDRAGAERARTTISEAQFQLAGGMPAVDEPARRQRLVTAAAVWLAYQDDLGGGAGRRERLGTTDWESYAWFAVGEIEQVAQRRDEALRLYSGALDRDAGNVGALVNLGAMLLRPAVSKSGEMAAETTEQQRERLGLSRKLLVRAATGAPGDDWTTPTYYRVRYLVAVCDLYQLQLSPDLVDRDLRLALEARRYSQAVLDGGDGVTEPVLASFLYRLRSPAKLVNLMAGLEIDPRRPPELSDFQEGWLSTEVLYNLACLYARWSFLEPARAANHRDESIAFLTLVIGRSAAMRDTARTDPGLRAALGTDPRFMALVRRPDPPPEDPSKPRLFDVTLHLGGMGIEPGVA